MRTRLLGALALAGFISSQSLATPIRFDDGVAHQISGPVVSDIELAGNTELRVTTGGTIVGSVTSDTGSMPGSPQLRMSGGTVAGNIDFWSGGTVVMESGTITGYVGGTSNTYDMLAPDVAILGGNILGGVYVDNQYVLMAGGYVGKVIDWIFADFAMTGGVVDGHLSTDAAWNLNISGGLVTGSMAIGSYYQTPATRAITGGTFTASGLDANGYLLRLSTTLDIFGGSFAESRFLLDEYGTLNVYGKNLSFEDGLLSGYLTDGNWFSQTIDIRGGLLNIHDVPEPSTLALFGLAIASLPLFRRRSTNLITGERT